MQNARVAAYVTFQYRQHTLPFLDRVLRNLSEFDVHRMHVSVVTSTDDAVQLALLDRLCRNYFDIGSFAIESFPNCDPGLMLTWKHKPLLRAAAMNPTENFSHFVYMEDDIGMTYRNFQYFTEYAGALHALRLIPAFLRTEFGDGIVRACDAPDPTIASRLVELPDCTFAIPHFPHSACWAMDRRHVTEYLSSRSFDFERSKEVCSWDIAERSAMGSCWDNPPAGFPHRCVLPVGSDLRPLACCQVQHMSDKYASIPASMYGKLPIERVFIPR